MTRREGRLQMPRPTAVRRNPQVEAVALVEASLDLNTTFQEILCARMGKNRHAVAGSNGGATKHSPRVQHASRSSGVVQKPAASSPGQTSACCPGGRLAM